jgi:hypothetical protein
MLRAKQDRQQKWNGASSIVAAPDRLRRYVAVKPDSETKRESSLLIYVRSTVRTGAADLH